MLFIATKNYCSGESEGWNIHFCSVWSAYWATETGCVTVSCQILIMFLDSNIGTRILFFFKLHNDTQLFMVHLIKSTPSYIQSQKILNLKDSAVSIFKHSFIQLYENTYSCVDLWLFICFNVAILWMGFDLFFGQFMNYKVMNKGYSWNLLWSKDNFRTWLSSPAGGGSVWSGLCWWASAVIDTDSGAEVIGSKVIVSSNGSITWHQDQALWSFDETKLHPCLDTDEILIRCFILFSLEHTNAFALSWGFGCLLSFCCCFLCFHLRLFIESVNNFWFYLHFDFFFNLKVKL